MEIDNHPRRQNSSFIALRRFSSILDLQTRAFYPNDGETKYGIERIEKLGNKPPVNKTNIKSYQKSRWAGRWKEFSFYFPI